MRRTALRHEVKAFDMVKFMTRSMARSAPELLPSTSFAARDFHTFWILSLGFRVSGLGSGFRASGFGFRVSGFGFRVSGLGFWV